MSKPDMYLIYLDESYDDNLFVYSAIFVNAFHWSEHFNHLLNWRKEWLSKYQIPMEIELHATNFVAGRGEPLRTRDKLFRAELFYEAIGRIEAMSDIKIINDFTNNKKEHIKLFEKMLNKINDMLKAYKGFGVLICDEGNEKKLTSTMRKMKRHNHMPDIFDNYGHNSTLGNIFLERIIEDPLFKNSKSSYFIQLADMVAFSLLRNKVPIEGSTKPKVQEAFNQLNQVLVKGK